MTAPVDVAVIGSGPVGSAFGAVVAEERPAARLVMIEMGPCATPDPGMHLRNLEDEEQRAAAHRRLQGRDQRALIDRNFLERAAADRSDRDALARPGLSLLDQDLTDATTSGLPAAASATGVGGMGVLWTASCPTPAGGERIDFIPWNDLEPSYDRANRLLGVRPSAVDDPVWVEIRRVLGTEFDTPPGRGASWIPSRRTVRPLPLAVMSPTADTQVWWGPNMILGPLLDAATDRFELRSETRCRRVDSADGVCRLELIDQRTGTADVLTARHVFIAADSLRTPQLLWNSGIRPAALGCYLNDHLQVLAAAHVDPDILKGADVPFGACWVPFDDDEHPFHGQVLSLGALPATAFDDESMVRLVRNVVGLSWFGRKEIRREDAVRFSEHDVDDDGMPRIEIHYDLTDRDRETAKAMHDAVARAASAVGTLVHDEPVLMPGGSSLHYQGTTRLGPRDDGTSVCDPYGRVWGTSNVWVGGNGVIPTATACNPTITSVALAVRAATYVSGLLDPSGGTA
jgi:choline dehydrogenase-like flavoprotein